MELGKYWSTRQGGHHWSCFGRWERRMIIATGNIRQVKSVCKRWPLVLLNNTCCACGRHLPSVFTPIISSFFVFNFFLWWRFSSGIHLKLIPGVRPLHRKGLQLICFIEIFCIILLRVERYIPVAYSLSETLLPEGERYSSHKVFSWDNRKMIVI